MIIWVLRSGRTNWNFSCSGFVLFACFDIVYCFVRAGRGTGRCYCSGSRHRQSWKQHREVLLQQQQTHSWALARRREVLSQQQLGFELFGCVLFACFDVFETEPGVGSNKERCCCSSSSTRHGDTAGSLKFSPGR